MPKFSPPLLTAFAALALLHAPALHAQAEAPSRITSVKLYPGSNVTTVNVDANAKDNTDNAKVELGFTSPAAPAKASGWMAGEFAKKRVQVTRTGDTLAGKTKDGDNFTISFAPDGANAKGKVLITKS